MAKKTESFNFEKSMQELEQIVSKMEEGNLSLEDSLTEFEKGVKLTNRCQQALTDAEQKVQILLESSDGSQLLKSFEPEQS